MRAELRRLQVHRAGRGVALIETLDVIAVGMPRDPVDKSVGTEDHKLATRVAGDDFAFLHEILDVRGVHTWMSPRKAGRRSMISPNMLVSSLIDDHTAENRRRGHPDFGRSGD